MDAKGFNIAIIITMFKEERAERGKIFLNFDKDISKFGVEVTL